MDTTSEDEALKPERKLNAYSSASFVVIFLFVGIPIWIMTTTVYRAPLPTSRIEALTLADISVPVKVKLSGSLDKAEFLIADLQMNLPKHKVFRIEFRFDYSVEGPDVGSMDSPQQPIRPLTGLDLVLRLLKGNVQTMRARIDCMYGILVEYPEKLEETKQLAAFLKSTILDHYLASDDLKEMLSGIEQKRRHYLTEQSESNTLESQMTSLFTWLRNSILMEDVKPPPKVVRRQKPTLHEFRSHLAPLPEYSIDIFLLNPRPEETCIPMLNTSRINDYLQYAFGSLSPVTKFKLSSQSIFYVDLPIHPAVSQVERASGEKLKVYTIPRSSLPHLISPIEKQIIPNMARDAPTRQFLIYLPPAGKLPLYIGDVDENLNGDDSFVISSWGGLTVYNEYAKACAEQGIHLASLDSRWIASRIVAQLRQLLALPATAPGLERPESCALAAVERDRAAAYAIFHHIYHSESTLVSLVGLLEDIKNIVIDDNVASLVERSVDQMETAISALREGNLSMAVRASTSAYEASEKAFFDKTLLALLYFPDEQKYAIYIPLFLPVGVPVVINVLRFLRSLKSRGKAKMA